MKKHLAIHIAGKVQGVGFRYEAKLAADRLSVQGYARNMRDGTVSLEVEGEENKLLGFLNWCKSDNTLATIKSIDIQEAEVKGYRDFQVY